MDLKEKLLTLRKENNLSQKQLSKQLNIGQSTICQWESGISKPNWDAIIKLCQFYDISCDFLCGMINEKGCYEKEYKDLNEEQNFFVNLYNNLNCMQKSIILSIIQEFFKTKQ